MEYIKDIVPTVLMLLEYHILITQIMKYITPTFAYITPTSKITCYDGVCMHFIMANTHTEAHTHIHRPCHYQYTLA